MSPIFQSISSWEKWVRGFRVGKAGGFADTMRSTRLIWNFRMTFYGNSTRVEFYSECMKTKETVKAKHRPIVIITSNAEKELPDAFLRRCIFHYIGSPSGAEDAGDQSMFIIKIWTSVPAGSGDGGLLLDPLHRMRFRKSRSTIGDYWNWLSGARSGRYRSGSDYKAVSVYRNAAAKRIQDIDTFESYKRGRGRFR